MNWKQRYLDKLGVTFERPDFVALCDLIQAHLLTVPYELLSKIHYYNQREDNGWLVPPVEVFVENLVSKGRGGNCYILNFNFGRLLEALGYQLDYCRVSPRHMAIRVYLGGQIWYVDVGYGAPTFRPLLLDEEPNFTSLYGEEVKITRLDEHSYEIERFYNEKSFVKKVIEWHPLTFADFEEDISFSHRDTDDNVFMRRASADRLVSPYRKVWIDTNRYLSMDVSGRHETPMPDVETFYRLIHETFGIDRDVAAEAVAFVTAPERVGKTQEFGESNPRRYGG
ncbi:arylamine N-acetyltransferase [Tumebacillus permanentifrigoris]|uniref:N-hydroxyarylamine O-acetyltransferase n=1 Tax=Tumebacillus permanentifrigoris TaxID=378543 RepID=A0A316E0K4_9BACL|nr:arylamine N-acetyltransferase [Tumebacillus permanentifrigoris]PWK16340.1 N-hydroxyarylamine O-acetyltransferase [Tumebacillus permanentifrigoris]